MTARITLIGGPTALVEFGGFRFLTDPTFDGPGDYKLPQVTLTKTSSPAIAAADIGAVDAVLLSHDQHADNLDNAGRDVLRTAPRVLTTRIGAQRLGGRVEGLAAWQTVTLTKPGGASVTITATPARHGPAGIEPLAGDVIGFVLTGSGLPPVYITGDTVWYDGVAEVARHRTRRCRRLCRRATPSGTMAWPRLRAASRPALKRRATSATPSYQTVSPVYITGDTVWYDGAQPRPRHRTRRCRRLCRRAGDRCP